MKFGFTAVLLKFMVVCTFVGTIQLEGILSAGSTMLDGEDVDVLSVGSTRFDGDAVDVGSFEL